MLTRGKNMTDVMASLPKDGRTDHTANGLIQKLYRLSGEAKVRAEWSGTGKGR